MIMNHRTVHGVDIRNNPETLQEAGIVTGVIQANQIVGAVIDAQAIFSGSSSSGFQYQYEDEKEFEHEARAVLGEDEVISVTV